MYIFLAGNLPSYRASLGSHGEKNTLTTTLGMLVRGCTTMDQQNHKETSLDF